jgi:hypothetical protein
MKLIYNKEKPTALEKAEIENTLIEMCDPQTRALLRLAVDVNVWSCEQSNRPKLMIHCKSREITAAIGSRQDILKTLLKRILGCEVTLEIYYNIPEDTMTFLSPHPQDCNF